MNLILKNTPQGLSAEVANSASPVTHIDTTKYNITCFNKQIKALVRYKPADNSWLLWHNESGALLISEKAHCNEYIKKQVKVWKTLEQGLLLENILIELIKNLKIFFDSKNFKYFLKNNSIYNISEYNFALFGIYRGFLMGLINFVSPLSTINRFGSGIQYHEIDRVINLSLRYALSKFEIPDRIIKHIQANLYPFSNDLFAKLTHKNSTLLGVISPQDAIKRPKSYYIFEIINPSNHLHIIY